jgi:hypothetical protein
MAWRERVLLLETGEQVTVQCGEAICFEEGYCPRDTGKRACGQVLTANGFLRLESCELFPESGTETNKRCVACKRAEAREKERAG